MKEIKPKDKVLVIKCRNAQNIEGQTVEVLRTTPSANIVVKTQSGAQATLYYTSPADDFVLANRENLLEYFTEKKEELLKEITQCEKEIEFYTKYNTMEEYVADKLLAIMKTDDRDKLATMLKELKTSNFL